MGTTQTGRILNTKGSDRTVSEYVLVHSVEGAYKNVDSKDPTKPLQLKNGGHGEDMFKILKKYNIGWTITKTFPNGVRVGNVENHYDPYKRLHNGQLWFPKHWKKKDILEAAEHVLSLKKNKDAKVGDRIYGMWKGVKVMVIKPDGKHGTIAPAYDQPEE